MDVVPGPKNLFYVESIFIIYWRYYCIAFLSKNTFNNTEEKDMIHFIGLPVVFVKYFQTYGNVFDLSKQSLENQKSGYVRINQDNTLLLVNISGL